MAFSVEKIFFSVDQRKDDEFDPDTGNTDVIIQGNNGEKYIASFFAYNNIHVKAIENKIQQEFLKGQYFWVENMVLVKSCKKEVIQKVVEEMIDEGEFLKAFQLV